MLPPLLGLSKNTVIEEAKDILLLPKHAAQTRRRARGSGTRPATGRGGGGGEAFHLRSSLYFEPGDADTAHSLNNQNPEEPNCQARTRSRLALIPSSFVCQPVPATVSFTGAPNGTECPLLTLSWYVCGGQLYVGCENEHAMKNLLARNGASEMVNWWHQYYEEDENFLKGDTVMR